MKKSISIILLVLLFNTFAMAETNNKNQTTVTFKISNVNYHFKYNEDVNSEKVVQSIIGTSEDIQSSSINLASPSQGEPTVTISIEVSIGIGSTYGKTTITVTGKLSEIKALTKQAIDTAKEVKEEMS